MGYHDKLGVAFSGGGIRSAAFCSGVLRRLLKKEAEPDYLSCVSGGGYTGSAYVHWKYRKSTNNFFDDMRKNAGYFCNYNCKKKTRSKGLGDCVPLFLLLLFVAIIFPILGWGSLAIPIAFIIKLLYGQFLDGTKCRDNGDSKDCLERNLLFSLSLLFFLLFHFFEYCCKGCSKDKNYIKMKWAKLLLKLGQLISGATFAFTFGPWFINDFLEYSPWYIQGGIISITAVFWFFVPVLRKYSSLVILIYFYSYVVYWHLYEKKFFTIKYTKEEFGKWFKISIILVALFSILGDVPLRMVHIYNRWRLKNAFYIYDEKNVKEQCCYCYDLFPGGHCSSCCCATCTCPPEFPDEPNEGEVTLKDLKGTKPEYISNMVVNNWRREYDREYCVLTMSSEGITVIDKQPQNNQSRTEPQQDQENLIFRDDYFRDILQPRDIKLSSAMAMSAAAVSPHLGKYKPEEQKLTHILTILNMEMAANVVYNMAGERHASEDCKSSCSKICHVSCLYIANFIVAVIIAVGGIFLWEALEPHTNSLSVCVTGGVVGGILLLLLILPLIIICIDFSGSTNCSVCSFSSLSGWLTVHLPVYRFLLSLLHFIHDGPKPPAMLHLSDGGHFENYGLLPLLKLRLPKILVADGSYIESNDDYAKEIIEVMELARELLGCSFTAMDGGDVLADIRNKYVYPQVEVGANPENVHPQKVYQRMYEFKVRYPDKGPFEVREGHIVLIAPRHQNDGEKSDDSVTWETEKEDLKINDWGSGPILREEDISNFPATSSCCEKSLFRCCAKGSAFPRHSTANQFFTPHLFSIYHREGYRACMKCDDFLKPPKRTTRLHSI
ncbi:uncharacterized protein LOC114531088 isoform X2 [Dendronephthya gigantea]|nr:uncharacterized protein LOC114531088 isoform X2 [Dendronephthya gigantea]